MSYAYRKGLRKNPGHYGGTNYGEVWWVTSTTLAGCPEMQKHYREFQRLRAKKKDCGFFGVKCRYDLEQKMEKQERLGKDAKKMCKVEDKKSEIELELEDELYEPAYLSEGSSYSPPAALPAASYAPPAASYAPVDQGMTNESTSLQSGNKKLLMYGGLAAGALVLVLLLRRR